MNRVPIIVGNWKMNKTTEEAKEFFHLLYPLVKSSENKIYLAVPFTSIEPLYKEAKNSNIVVGGQNMNDASKGAFTGEIAGIMLKTSGAEFVILGHSERRQIFKENDDFINKKVIRALKDDLEPILCIGETKQEREDNLTNNVLQQQLKKGLKNISKEDANKIIIAYEPIWAIGTGETASPQQAQTAHLFIRETLEEMFGKKIATSISILYGGSVNPDNIKDLIKQRDIDGVLVGGASLDSVIFSKIINSC